LRISDILDLKYENIFTNNPGKPFFREYVVVTEKKTHKKVYFKLSGQLRDDLKSYVIKNKLQNGDFIFFSHNNKSKQLDRTNWWRVMKKLQTIFHTSNLGSHSLRKTFGYHYYQETKDIAGLMKILNHSSQKITLRYIGIEQENINIAYESIQNIYEKKDKVK
jgi:integrase